MPFDDDIKSESMTSTLAWTSGVVAFCISGPAFVASQ